jgi:hypothetical protein
MVVERCQPVIVGISRHIAVALLAAACAAAGCASAPASDPSSRTSSIDRKAGTPDRGKVITREELQRHGGVTLEDALGRSSPSLIVNRH